jgi:hypothetical protein
MSEERKEKHAQDLSAGDATGASPPDVRRTADEDLPPELKAIEAALASLSPRTDRLDRERLIFLAGQQSMAGGHIGVTKRVRRWGWPAALGAMTTVAASLLVALLVRGQPPVEVRIVKVPVEAAGNGEVLPGPDAQVPPGEGPRLGPPRENPERLPAPVPGSGLFALVGLDWAQLYDRDRLSPETSYPGLRDRVLREGVDSWPAPSPGTDVKSTSAPVPYRKLLNRALGTPQSDEPALNRPLLENLLFPGAHS